MMLSLFLYGSKVGFLFKDCKDIVRSENRETKKLEEKYDRWTLHNLFNPGQYDRVLCANMPGPSWELWIQNVHVIGTRRRQRYYCREWASNIELLPQCAVSWHTAMSVPVNCCHFSGKTVRCKERCILLIYQVTIPIIIASTWIVECLLAVHNFLLFLVVFPLFSEAKEFLACMHFMPRAS